MGILASQNDARVRSVRGKKNFDSAQRLCLQSAMASLSEPDGSIQSWHDYWENVRQIYRAQYPEHEVTNAQIRDHGSYLRRKNKVRIPLFIKSEIIIIIL